jgi:lipopolysaccharide export system permease protein
MEANTVKRFKNSTIVTGPVTGQAIGNIIILDRTTDGERRVIMAENAELKDGGREGLSLDLSGAFIQSSKEIVRNDYDYASSEFLRYWVPQEEIIQAVSSIGPNQMSSSDLWREISARNIDQAARLDEHNARVLAQALDLEESLRRGPSDEVWNRRENNLNNYLQEYSAVLSLMENRSLFIYRMEFFKKFSIPFGALSFVLLAVSLGLMARKSGQAVGFIFGLLISVIYWSMIFMGQTMGLRLGFPPFWSMWLPNILALAIGLVLFMVRLRK